MVKWFESKYRRILPLVILLVFFCIQYFIAAKRFQSFRFADEDEHLVPAFEMIHFGKTLYRDLSTNHQPVPIDLAKIELKLIPTNNLYMTIERTRQFMFLLSFVGAVVLTCRFGYQGLLASILIETVKFYLFGYYLLAESVIVYPIMFVSGLIVEKKLDKNHVFQKIDNLALGIAVPVIAFSLLPVWPFLVLVITYLVRRLWLHRWWFIFPAIITTLVIFIDIDIMGWIRETIQNNLAYFIPFEQSRDFTSWSLIKFPILVFFHFDQPVARFYAFGFIFTLISFSKIQFRLIAFCVLGFILLNVRVANPGVSFYQGFHLLPQVAFLTILSTFIVSYGQKKLLLIFCLVLLISSSQWWQESLNFDKKNDYFISYSETESIALAISALRQPGDKLLAGPQDGLLNLAADIPLATRQTSYLDWAYRVPQLRREFSQIFEVSAPTFVYFPVSDNKFFQAERTVLQNEYTRVYRTFGKVTDLYIRTDKISGRSLDQWQKFRYLLYQPPNEN